MNKPTNKTLLVAKYNFGIGTKEAYIITTIVVGIWIIKLILSGYSGKVVSVGNYFCLIIIFAPIFIVGKHYKKLIGSDTKKMDFFRGCVINYFVFSVLVALINMLFHYELNPMIFGDKADELLSYSTAFGWTKDGVVAFFFYQLGTYILVSLFIHTFVLYQNMWIGWVVDVLIVTMIGLSIYIAPLHECLASFFCAFIFNPSVFLQFIYSLFLGGVIYISTLYNLAIK